MRNWLLRGLVFAAAMVVVRLVQGTLINAWQTQAGLISIVLLLLFVICVITWGVLDGRADAKAQADPDRRQDMAMVWLLAGLVAGVVRGAAPWGVSLFFQSLYAGSVINELTTFAAFTALLVFIPGIVGVAFGRWRVDRNPPPGRPGTPEDERADTDVFSAVRADETPTGEMATQRGPTAYSEERTGSVATVERDTPTEVIRTSGREETTETIPTVADDAKTEVIRTDPRHAKPGSEPNRD